MPNRTAAQPELTNFEIPKLARFSIRVIECVLAAIFLYFQAATNKAAGKTDEIFNKNNIYDVLTANMILAIISLMVALGLVGQYFVSFIVKKWNSKKILISELTFDVIVAILWLACFIALLVVSNGQCRPGKSNACDLLNWCIAWNFMCFMAWSSSAFLDGKDLYEGLSGGKKLTDMEIMQIIRKTSRQ